MAGFDGCSTMEVFCKLNVVFIIMDLRLSVISIVAMIALPVFSQEDSIKTVHRIAADAVPATIFHTNEFLRGGNEEIRTMNHDMTFTLKYAFMNRDEVRPGLFIRECIRVWAWQGMSSTDGWQTLSLFICSKVRLS